MGQLPTGNVTFLITDIEQSTRLLSEMGQDAYLKASEEHYDLMRSAVGDHGGVEVRTEGDSLFAVFADPLQAAMAASTIQRSLQQHEWASGHEIWVRIGLHSGQGILGGDNYVGIDVNHAARISDAGNGGQTLLSQATADLVRSRLPDALDIGELGVHRLKDFEAEPLYQLNVAGLRQDFPALRSLTAADRLPAPGSLFVGRSEEIEAVSRLLDHSRLVTLVGPGGMGKTRLGIEVARSVQDGYADGAIWVDLSQVTNAGAVGVAVSEALGLRTQPERDPLEQVGSYLEARRMLVVLDNYEQLARDPSPVSKLLEAAPGIKLLVTSRVPLHLDAEQEFPVGPLGLDGTGDQASEGGELFLVRAREVDPGFDLSGTDREALATLIHRLDGVPLAIELAASRVKLLPLTAILERLDNRLLARSGGDGPTRQQTMNGAIAWSYDLLSDSQQWMLSALSVFSGGAGLKEIEQVLAPDYEDDLSVLEDLSGLVDHSLISLTRGGSPRYRMLEVVRDYARNKLHASGRDNEIRVRHRRVFREVAAEARPHLLTSDRARWMDRLESDHDNIRLALDQALTASDPDAALDIVSSMWRFWQTRGPMHEAAMRIEDALAMPGGDPILRARALAAAGGIDYWIGDFASMGKHYREAIELVGETPSQDRAEALYNLSFVLAAEGEYEKARAVVTESGRVSEEVGDPSGMARSFWGYFNISWYEGDFAATEEFGAETIARFEDIDKGFDWGWACYAVGDSMMRRDDVDGAAEMFIMPIQDFVDAGDLAALILFLRNLAAVAFRRGEMEKAAKLLGSSQGLMERTGSQLIESAEWSEPTKELWGDLRELSMTHGEFVLEGRAMGPEAAVDFARSAL